jgi:hypothetical protein
LNTLLRLEGIEEGSTVEFKDGGVNYHKRQDSTSEICGFNIYINQGENID